MPNTVGLSGLADWFGVAALSIPLYLLLAMKRFYDESWVKTVAKFVFVSVTYQIVWIGTLMGLLVVSLLSF